MTSPINILFITSHFKAMGGAEKNIIELARGLDRERFSCRVAVLQSGPLVKKLEEIGVPVWDVNLTRILSWRAILKGLDLIRYVKRHRIDVVVGYHHDADIWGGVFSMLAGVPAVVSSRRDMGNLLEPKHVWAYRVLNRFFTRIIAVADAVKRQVVDNEWAPAERVVTLYNGVETAPYRRPVDVARKKRELGLSVEAPVVGMVANFRPVKAQDVFVSAASRVLTEVPNAQFVIVGYKNTDFYRKVEQSIRRLGLADKVHCVGGRPDVPEILRTLDVFVLSSMSEGFSNAIIEAMASGVVVVATRSGGNPEAVLDGKTGFIVEPRDVRQLSDSIIRILRDAELRARFLKAADEHLARKFTYERMISSASNLFTELAGRSVEPQSAPMVLAR